MLKAKTRYGEARAGDMNRRVTLYEPDVTDDGQGGETVGDPIAVATVWAHIAAPRFAEATGAGGPVSIITQGIMIRKRAIGADWLVEYAGTMYRILHIDYAGVRNMTLTCEAVIHNG